VTGNKLEKEIIGIFNRNISAFLSINKISKKLRKAYPYINTKVNQLIKEGILNKTVIGKSYLCSINLENDKAIALLILNEAIEKQSFFKSKKFTKLEEEIKDIKKKFKIYTVFYADKKLHFVLDHIYDKEAIKNSYKEIKIFSLQFYSKQDFYDVILQKKSLLSNKIILYSPEKYFELVSEIKEKLMMKHLQGRN